MLDLDQGFLALPRRLVGSTFFRSLRPEERWILIEILLAARYAEGGEFWFAGTRIPLAPGELIEAEETIARASGSTRKCVRTVLKKAIRARLMDRRKVHPAGQCPSVTTVRDYDRIRFAGGDAGPRNGPPTGSEGADGGANEGPVRGPPKGPIRTKGTSGTTETQGNQGDTLLSPSPAAPASRGSGRGKGSKEPDPRHRPLQDRLEAVFLELRPTGSGYGFHRRDAKAITELLAFSGGDIAEVERRWRMGLAESGFRRCDSIHELASKWNAYSAPGESTRPGTRAAPAKAAPAAGPDAFNGIDGGF